MVRSFFFPFFDKSMLILNLQMFGNEVETGICVLSQHNEQIKWNLHLSLLVHDVTLLDFYIEVVLSCK